MLQNYQFNIEIYQHNPLHLKYMFAWLFTYIFYLPWVFIGNLGLKSYGEWAQMKYEKAMDALEKEWKLVTIFSILFKYDIIVLIYKMVRVSPFRKLRKKE